MSSLPPTECCSIDPNSVSQSTRSSWCQANLNTCSSLCNSQGGIGSGANQCDYTTLEYTCKCANGIEPDLSEYAQTVPSFECSQWQSNCLSAGGSREECDTVKCGNKDADEEQLSAGDPVPSSTPAPSQSSAATNILSGLPTFGSNNPTRAPNSSSRTSTTLRDSTQTSSSSTPSTTGPPESRTTNVSDPKDNPPNSTPPPSSPSGLSTGAKAGAGIGALFVVLLLILLTFYIRRRRRTRNARNGISSYDTLHPSDEKQLAVPIASEISQKAELDSGNPVGGRAPPVELDGGLYHNSRPEAYMYGEGGQGVELPSSTRVQEMSGDGVAGGLGGGLGGGQMGMRDPHGGDQRGSSFRDGGMAQMDTGVEPRSGLEPSSEVEPRSEVEPKSEPQLEPERSLAPTAISSKPLSADEIEALEEEERRLDEEMAEVQRMKELREKKFAVQQKLKEAKRR